MLIAHSLIAGGAAFVVVLAAWWPLRRSAHLLPHLRRGPSSFQFDPGYGRFASWIMAIGTPQEVSARGCSWWLARQSAVAGEHAHQGASIRLRLQPGPR